LLRQGWITGRQLATCRRRRTPWWSPSGTGSENSTRTRSAGQPYKSTSWLPPTRTKDQLVNKPASDLRTVMNHPSHGYQRIQQHASVSVDAHGRYWSHVVQCRSCNAALKAMKALEVALQVASVPVIGFLSVAKGTVLTSTVQRAAVVSTAVLCFAASR
jgi:ribulose bisphosphate carboxylase small subunit